MHHVAPSAKKGASPGLPFKVMHVLQEITELEVRRPNFGENRPAASLTLIQCQTLPTSQLDGRCGQRTRRAAG